MKCNLGKNLVCTSYENCGQAVGCPNVPKGIEAKLANEARQRIKKRREEECKKELSKKVR